jgi:ATP-dependent DNA helicase MPH1
LRNDIEKGLVDVRTISCVVVDEAHRASGKFAYVEGKKIVVPTLVMMTVD